jgi:AraC-like DNA-binding protein
MGLPAVLRLFGVNPADMLSKCGLDARLFDNAENLISYGERTRLVRRCAETTNCPHFALLVGERVSLSSLGLVGLLVKFSPDVGTALRKLVRHLRLYGNGATATLSVEGGAAFFAYHIEQPEVPGSNEIAEGSLAGMFNMLGELCGPDWKASEVWFAHPKPEHVEPLRRFFHAFLRFGAGQNAIVFSSSWLNRALPQGNDGMRRLLQERVDALEIQHPENFAQQVGGVVRAALATGDVSSDQIAALFSMHPRTLNRRLRAYGVGFQELLDRTRFEIAQQMLNGSALDIEAIAIALDYAGARPFIRAFRRWSGTTPAQWRASDREAKKALFALEHRATPVSVAP